MSQSQVKELTRETPLHAISAQFILLMADRLQAEIRARLPPSDR